MRILSIDGGGYLGLATASFLQAIEARFKARCADRFDLFCGTSTGAIIALALASGKSGAEVVALYERLGKAVFAGPYFERRLPRSLGNASRWWRRIWAPLYSSSEMKSALEEAFGDLSLGDLRKRGKRVLVTSLCVTSGTPRIFKTDHAPELRAHDGYLVRDVAMASSAAPVYFPLVELADPVTGTIERFCDGGIVANSPALLGYAEAVSHLGITSNDIAILSVGTPRADLSERSSSTPSNKRSLARGLLGWELGERIINLTIDGSSVISDAVLNRIAPAAGARYTRVWLAQPRGLGLDVVTSETTQTLRQLGAEAARDSARLRDLSPLFTGMEIPENG